MSSPALRIRVRCPSVLPTPVQLQGCTSQTTFAEFQVLVLRALNLESGDSENHGHGPTILAGFPPRPLDLPKDAEIGSVLSDNENVTVRLPTQPAGGANPEGGKWGRGRSRRPPTTATAPSSTRSSARALSKPDTAGATANGDAGVAAGLNGGSVPSSTTGVSKGKGKGRASADKAVTGSSGTEGVPASNGAGRGSGGGRGGRGVHTLAGPLAPPTSRPVAAAAAATGGIGGISRATAARASPPGQVRTLFGSGSSSAAAAAGGEESGPARKRGRAGAGIALKSEGDIADRLLQAVGGGGKGTADRFFRKAMKLAVDKQYDQSRADARVRAALGGWYTAVASATQRRLGDGESVALSISFSKGDGAKSQFEETVDRIPREQVAAVVRMIARDPESREMLKPHNFAGCSPRMFWSLVEYWGGDVPRALRLAAPDVDWGFVDTRDRKPSEKAVANAVAEEAARREAEEERAEKERAKEAKRKARERKKRKREGLPTESSDEDQDALSSTANGEERAAAAAAAAAADEDAAADEPPLEEAPDVRLAAVSAAASAADARQRAANAALARLTASQRRPLPGDAVPANRGSIETDATRAATAAEVVVGSAAEEAGAAAAGAVSSENARREGGEGEGDGEVEDEVDMEGLVEVAGDAGAGLLVAAGVRTLGQLADRDEEELARELGVLQGGVSAAGGSGSGGGSVGEGVRPEKVAEWVQGARGEELDEIMADIVDGDEDVIEALEEVAISTPRDLVRLGAFPDVLVGAVRERLGADRFAPLEGRITPQAVEAWRRKGDRLLEQRPWLELWVHEG